MIWFFHFNYCTCIYFFYFQRCVSAASNKLEQTSVHTAAVRGQRSEQTTRRIKPFCSWNLRAYGWSHNLLSVSTSQHDSHHQLLSSWIKPSGRPLTQHFAHRTASGTRWPEPLRVAKTVEENAAVLLSWLCLCCLLLAVHSRVKHVALQWWISHKHAASPSWPHNGIPVRSEPKHGISCL